MPFLSWQSTATGSDNRIGTGPEKIASGRRAYFKQIQLSAQ